MCQRGALCPRKCVSHFLRREWKGVLTQPLVRRDWPASYLHGAHEVVCNAIPLSGLGLRYPHNFIHGLHCKSHTPQVILPCFLTAVFTAKLLDFKARTELSTTKRLLNSLIFHAVENGAVTTLCAALNLAFYITRSQDNIHVILCVSWFLWFRALPHQPILSTANSL